jgi:hypothetical protein
MSQAWNPVDYDSTNDTPINHELKKHSRREFILGGALTVFAISNIANWWDHTGLERKKNLAQASGLEGISINRTPELTPSSETVPSEFTVKQYVDKALAGFPKTTTQIQSATNAVQISVVTSDPFVKGNVQTSLEQLQTAINNLPTTQNHNPVTSRDGSLSINNQDLAVNFSPINSRLDTLDTNLATKAFVTDPRLSDARIPLSHTHTLSQILQSSATTGQVPIWNGTTWTPSTVSGTGDMTKAVYDPDNDGKVVSAISADVSTNTTQLNGQPASFYATNSAFTSGLATKADLIAGKVPASQLPAIAISDTFVVANQAAQLLLSAQTGDIAVRTDLNKTFILKGANPTVLSDWQELLTPTDSVQSVNGLQGNVILTTSGVTEGSNLYYTNTRGIGSTLTGFIPNSGAVSSADTVLTAIQKLQGSLTTILPSQTGNGGKVLQTDGSVATWQTPAASGLVTADNGLTATGGNVQLGGSLINSTIIDQFNNDLFFQTTTGRLQYSTTNPANSAIFSYISSSVINNNGSDRSAIASSRQIISGNANGTIIETASSSSLSVNTGVIGNGQYAASSYRIDNNANGDLSTGLYIRNTTTGNWTDLVVFRGELGISNTTNAANILGVDVTLTTSSINVTKVGSKGVVGYFKNTTSSFGKLQSMAVLNAPEPDNNHVNQANLLIGPDYNGSWSGLWSIYNNSNKANIIKGDTHFGSVLAPTAKVQITTGTSGDSGLQFTNMTSVSPAVPGAGAIGVDSTGKVVRVTGGGVVNYAVTTQTTNFNASAADDVLLLNTTATSVQITLPTAVGNLGKHIRIKWILGANIASVVSASGVIDGLATYTFSILNQTIEVISDGTNWYIF